MLKRHNVSSIGEITWMAYDEARLGGRFASPYRDSLPSGVQHYKLPAKLPTKVRCRWRSYSQSFERYVLVCTSGPLARSYKNSELRSIDFRTGEIEDDGISTCSKHVALASRRITSWRQKQEQQWSRNPQQPDQFEDGKVTFSCDCVSENLHANKWFTAYGWEISTVIA